MKPSSKLLRTSGSTALRVILLVLAVGLAINLMFQIRKIWKRMSAPPAAVEAAAESETPATNRPPATMVTNLTAVAPAPVMVMAPEPAPQLVVLAPPAEERPEAPKRAPAGSGGGSGGSPPGFGTIGFPPGVAPVVWYQPGTLTFVAIPVDPDDTTTNRPQSAHNLMTRFQQLISR